MRLTASARHGALSPALELPYTALVNAGLALRPGQLSLTIAGPGVGKSQLWLNFVTRMQRFDERTQQMVGLPALYASADTDSHDVYVRSASLLTSKTSQEVERDRKDSAWAAWYAERLRAARHVEWVFDSTITSEYLARRLNAFAEVHGEYPQVVVVDNLANVVTEHDAELSQQKAFLRDAQDLAYETRAHIAVLSHAEGQYDSGDRAIPLSGVLNKISKIPSVVLTLYRANEDGTELGVCVAKNRGGVADPAARRPIFLQVDFSRASVYGFDNRSAA